MSGQAAWARELDAARDYALSMVATVGAARGWTADQRAWAASIVTAYAEDADGWFSDDVAEFWRSLARHMRDALADGAIVLDTGGTAPLPVGLDKLAAALEAAHAAATGTATADAAGSPLGLVVDTAKASAGDVGAAVVDVSTTAREVLLTAGDAARTLRNRKVLAGVTIATLAVGGALWLWSRR